MADILLFRDGVAVSEAPVSLEAFQGQSNATAVRIEPGEDARALLSDIERIALVEVTFPVFGEGRGYSSARILREAGYTGELRASGDVLVDQIAAMRRVGFDSFAPKAPLDSADVEAALNRFPDVYQKTIDGRQPIWAKRHTGNAHA